MTKLVYLDCETTGLDPDLHDVWEIAIIDHAGREHAWQIKPDLTHADPRALEIGGYWDRHFTITDGVALLSGTCKVTHHWDAERVGEVEVAEEVAQQVAELLAGAAIVGSNPDFDRGFLRSWLRRHGQVLADHYRALDVVTLGWGQLIPSHPEVAGVPPSSHGVSRAFGIEPDDYDRHTALGDARWVRDLYRAITKEA